MGLLALIAAISAATPAAAQNLQVREDLDFGLMDIAALPGTASLGTDASIAYSGGLIGDGFGSTGEIRIAGRSGTPVQISCSTSATLSNGSHTIDLTNIRISRGTRDGPRRNTRDCEGIGMNVVRLISGNGNLNWGYIGATLETTGVESDGEYDTANSGGVPILIEMVIP